MYALAASHAGGFSDQFVVLREKEHNATVQLAIRGKAVKVIILIIGFDAFIIFIIHLDSLSSGLIIISVIRSMRATCAVYELMYQ